MAYKLAHKRARNKDIVEKRKLNPDMTQAEIAEHFRISQPRVSRILKGSQQ